MAMECELQGDRLIVCQVCEESFGCKSNGYELANCNHGFCRTCIRNAMEKRILDLIQMEGMDDLLNNFEYVMQCPVEGCNSCLSRHDLRLVLGQSMQELLDECIMTSVAYQVVYPLVRCCPNCKDVDQQLLIPTSQAHILSGVHLRKAFTCNGLDLPHGKSLTKKYLVKHFKNSTPSCLLCSRCSFLICQDCGLKPAVLPGMDAHHCDPLRRNCFYITRSLMKLWSAYSQETTPCTDRRKTKRQRMCSGFSSSSNRELKQQKGLQDSKELLYERLVKRFSDISLQDMTEVYAVDKLAETSLQELKSCISHMLNDGEGAISPIISALVCSHDLLYTSLKWLVKNDSLVDMAARSGLFRTLLSFMQTLSESWDFLPLLCSREAKHDCMATQSRWEMPGSIMLNFKKFDTQAEFMLRQGVDLLQSDLLEKEYRKGQMRKQPKDCALSDLVADVKMIYDLLHKRIMMWEGKTLQHNWLADINEVSSLTAKDGQQPLQDQIKAFIKQMVHFSSSPIGVRRVRTRSMQIQAEMDHSELSVELPSDEDNGAEVAKDKVVATMQSAELVEAYQRALRPLQFEEACLLPTHYYRHQVANSKALMLNKKRARAISEEMTLLNTVLPLEWGSSIFLRMDEQRADVLRALIIGPEGTPYENGVFLFDLFLKDTYPDTPPSVHFLTTGGGKVRFNPNLYDNGYVCLSLLGTWHGPGWKPGESSILQVLLSIQGLILVADPYYNEPNSELWGKRGEADRYRSSQRINTMKLAILASLCSPDPLFLPVIRTHFQLKAPFVLSQCTAWMEEECNPVFKSQFPLLIDQLRVELDKLTDAHPKG